MTIKLNSTANKFFVALTGVVVMILQQGVANGFANIDWGTIIPAFAAAILVWLTPNAVAAGAPVAPPAVPPVPPVP